MPSVFLILIFPLFYFDLIYFPLSLVAFLSPLNSSIRDSMAYCVPDLNFSERVGRLPTSIDIWWPLNPFAFASSSFFPFLSSSIQYIWCKNEFGFLRSCQTRAYARPIYSILYTEWYDIFRVLIRFNWQPGAWTGRHHRRVGCVRFLAYNSLFKA
jgi:hypothetical protein